jgi:hypothetical protein
MPDLPDAPNQCWLRRLADGRVMCSLPETGRRQLTRRHGADHSPILSRPAGLLTWSAQEAGVTEALSVHFDVSADGRPVAEAEAGGIAAARELVAAATAAGSGLARAHSAARLSCPGWELDLVGQPPARDAHRRRPR